MQMMWARCISDGIRAVCPAATAGQYTVEETQDFDEAAAPVQKQDEPPAPMVMAVPVPEAADSAAAPAAPVAPPPVDPAAVAMPMAMDYADQPPVAAPVSEAPAPAMPVAPPAQPEAPFPLTGPDGLDYTICRAEGPYKGMKWALVPPEKCRLALAVTCPNIYEQDREEIRRVLAANQ